MRGRARIAAAAAILLPGLVAAVTIFSLGQAATNPPPASPTVCPTDAGITLSPGFCATVFADNLGHARHLAVAPDGTVYVNTWSGVYYDDDTPPAGGFLVALRDTKGQGRADVVERFGPGVPQGSAGGTGIAYYKGAIYAEMNDRILRYPLPAGASCRTGRRRWSSPACRSAGIIPCIPS
jgi:glucose/arabinose dehydrogenase